MNVREVQIVHNAAVFIVKRVGGGKYSSGCTASLRAGGGETRLAWQLVYQGAGSALRERWCAAQKRSWTDTGRHRG